MAGSATPFAQSGFTTDPNLSPNNQNFSLAVYAVVKRLGLGTGGGGTGSVTSIAGTSIGTGSAALVITGSPITTSGTLTFALHVFDGTNAGVVPASAGGSVNFLRADGSFAAPPGGGGTGSVTQITQGTGIIVTNGTLTTTGTVSVDASWSPTWSKTHDFNGTAAAIVLGAGTSMGWGGGTQFMPALQMGVTGGLMGGNGGNVYMMGGIYYNGTNYIFTGTNTNNSGTSTGAVLSVQGNNFLNVQMAAAAGTFGGTAVMASVFQISGTVTNNKIQGYGPNAAGLVDMTPDTGTFVGTYGGFTAALTGTAYWSRHGNIVVLALPIGTGSSNATTMTFAPIPAAIQPTRTQFVALNLLQNNGVNVTGMVQVVAANGTLTFFQGAGGAAWTSSGAKSIGGGAGSLMPVSYILGP